MQYQRLIKALVRFVEIVATPITALLHRLESWESRNVQRDYIYERGIEYSFALKHLMDAGVSTVLDVGSGRSAFPALLRDCGFHVTAIDERKAYWRGGFLNRHYPVLNDDICRSRLSSELMDAVLCISVLEHISEYERAVAEMVRILKPDGVIVLSFPYNANQYCDNVYALPDSDEMSSSFPYIAHAFCESIVSDWNVRYGLIEVERQYFQGWTGEHWRCGRRIDVPRVVVDVESANGICLCLKKSTL